MARPDSSSVSRTLIFAGGPKRLLVLVLVLVLMLGFGAGASAELPQEVKQALASRNFASAVVWLEANVNDPEAAFELGRLYRLGMGVPENPEQALTLFRASAEAGYADAQYQLAKHYERTGDPAGATFWMAEAKVSGHRRAMNWAAPVATPRDRDLVAMIRVSRPPPEAASTAETNRTDGNGKTPLMAAAAAGDTGWLKFLLDKNAAVDAKDRYNVTALQRAVIGEHAAAVDLLLKVGADPDVVNSEGNTALHLAVATGSVGIAGLLVAAGADKDLQNSAGWSAEALAARSGDTLMMRGLGLHESPDERVVVFADSAELDRLVVDAALRGNEALLDELLSQRSFDADSMEFQVLLVRLSAAAAVPALEKLVAAGVPVNGDNERGQTSLMVAAESGCLRCVEVLVGAGARLEASDVQGRTALLYAARAGHDSVALLLLEEGARIDAVDELERNALWWAVREQRWTVAGHLLAKGSPVRANAQGINPLHLTAEANYGSILPLLAPHLPVDESTVDGNTALLIAAGAGSTSAAGELLRLGADVNYSNKLRDTALIIAVRQSDLPMARLLLEAGADTRARNDRFESAQSIVAARGEAEWSRLLESSQRSVLDLLGTR